MNAQEFFQLVAAFYRNRPDDFRLTLGHHFTPVEGHAPDFAGGIAVNMRQVRTWADGQSTDELEDLRDLDGHTAHCNDCGGPMFTEQGVAYHCDEDGNIDHNLDADHVAMLEPHRRDL